MITFRQVAVDAFCSVFGENPFVDCQYSNSKDTRLSSTCKHISIVSQTARPTIIKPEESVHFSAKLSGTDGDNLKTRLQIADLEGNYIEYGVAGGIWVDSTLSGNEAVSDRCISKSGHRKARFVLFCSKCGRCTYGGDMSFEVEFDCVDISATISALENCSAGGTGQISITAFRMIDQCKKSYNKNDAACIICSVTHDDNDNLSIKLGVFGGENRTDLSIKLLGERTFNIAGNDVSLGAFQAKYSDGSNCYDAKAVQCVSLIKQLCLELTATPFSPAGNGKDVYKNLSNYFRSIDGYTYTTFDAGATDNPPQSGDIISFDGNGGTGHVAIVDSIETDPNDPNTITVHLFEQNGGNFRSFNMKKNKEGNWVGEINSSTPVLGWGHISND